MPLHNAAELICKRALHGIRPIVAHGNTVQFDSIRRRNHIEIVLRNLIYYKVDGNILHPSTTDLGMERNASTQTILVLTFNMYRFSELKRNKVVQINRRQGPKLANCSIKIPFLGEKVDVARCPGVRGARQHALPALKQEMRIGLAKYTAQQPMKEKPDVRSIRIHRR